jgi:hypothetical protein
MATLQERFNDRWMPEPFSGCWLWTGTVNGKYGQMSLGHRLREYAHRTSWKLHVGGIPQGRFVLHRCDTPLCVNPEHLFLGTLLDNARDCISKGRRASFQGEFNSQSKLNEAQVSQIRHDPRTQREIAADYGVDRSTISYIQNHKTWFTFNRSNHLYKL